MGIEKTAKWSDVARTAIAMVEKAAIPGTRGAGELGNIINTYQFAFNFCPVFGIDITLAVRTKMIRNAAKNKMEARIRVKVSQSSCYYSVEEATAFINIYADVLKIASYLNVLYNDSVIDMEN
jgi:hypothetical protein